MGGNALLIYGRVSEDRVRKAPAWTSLGKDRRLVTLSNGTIEKLPGVFLADLERRFVSPWKASGTTLQYLRDAMTLYLRGDEETGKPVEWYIQLTFSGSAGLSEVSSELAVHWAERWFTDRSSELTSAYLAPGGFAPNGNFMPTNTGHVFVPLGEWGYGIVDRSASDSEGGAMLDVDQWVLEANEDADPTVMLEQAYTVMPSLRTSNSCHCQWCMPDLDPTPLDHVVF